jgi:hypothetical protein
VDSVAIAGTDSGTKMRHRIVQRDAPSRTAASSSSLGIVMRNCRMRNGAVGGEDERHDERHQAVHPADRHHELVQRDDQDDERDHHRADVAEEQRVAARRRSSG